MKKSLVAAAAIALANLSVLAAIGLSGSGSGGSGEAAVVIVIPRGAMFPLHSSDYYYQPWNVKVKVGDTVRWINLDDYMHTVTADNGEFHATLPSMGDSFTHTFTRAGNFSYHCVPHPWMKGYVEVSGPG